MKPENDPITDVEWILRRVHRQFFPTADAPMVSTNAFRPRTTGRDIDSDGISVYRESCIADPLEIFAALPEAKRTEQGIIRLSVTFLKSLGLTVAAVPFPPIPGHAVIPELNAAEYTADKARLAVLLVRLAEEASKPENIVRHPEPLVDLKEP